MLDDDRAGGGGLFAWPAALVVAACFGMVFALLVLLGGLTLGDEAHVEREAAGLGLAAFIGYLAVAALVRRDQSS